MRHTQASAGYLWPTSQALPRGQVSSAYCVSNRSDMCGNPAQRQGGCGDTPSAKGSRSTAAEARRVELLDSRSSRVIGWLSSSCRASMVGSVLHDQKICKRHSHQSRDAMYMMTHKQTAYTCTHRYMYMCVCLCVCVLARAATFRHGVAAACLRSASRATRGNRPTYTQGTPKAHQALEEPLHRT